MQSELKVSDGHEHGNMAQDDLGKEGVPLYALLILLPGGIE
jgi:hypothetical protein